MLKITLDSNIYDLIALSPEIKDTVNSLSERGDILIQAPEFVVRELEDSPFCGIPDWFQVEVTTDSVFVVGVTPFGQGTLGGGTIYDEHLGNSKKYKDAVIADTAHGHSDILVTCDNRFRKRFQNISTECKVLVYTDFENLILHMWK